MHVGHEHIALYDQSTFSSLVFVALGETEQTLNDIKDTKDDGEFDCWRDEQSEELAKGCLLGRKHILQSTPNQPSNPFLAACPRAENVDERARSLRAL